MAGSDSTAHTSPKNAAPATSPRTRRSGETALTEALGQSVSLRRRGSLLTDLALVGVQRRDLDQLLRYGHDAIDLAEQTQSSGYVGRKLQILKIKLEPFLNDNRAAQLTDRIANLPTPPDERNPQCRPRHTSKADFPRGVDRGREQALPG